MLTFTVSSPAPVFDFGSGAQANVTIAVDRSASAILVPVAGRDGTSITLEGLVPTYADLPRTLGAADKGDLYVVSADGLGYVWSGTAWPADGQGVEIRGPRGETGRGYTGVTVAGDDLVFATSDSTQDRVTVPALAAASSAASDAQSHAQTASTQAGVATTQAGVAAGHASAANGAAAAAAQSALDAHDVVATGVPDATASVKGGIVLTGDLGGTWDSPTVPGLELRITVAQGETIAAQAIDAWVGAAPAQLDTLNELATALGNDPNFASTVTASLAGKAPLSHTHQIAHVDGLQDALSGKAAASHTHTIAQVSGLQDALGSVAVTTERVTDMSSVGRAVATAASTAAARNSLGIGIVPVRLTQAQYNALPTPRDPNTLYLIKG